MSIQEMTAADAIKRSQDFSEIVHVLNLPSVEIGLLAECDDWVENGEGDDGEKITEYWGANDDGDWRVHLHG